jgi:putative ABC transport system permease protein
MDETSEMRSKLSLRDVFAVGSVGLRTRKLRTGLTALGIAIGIAALVAVMGISASSKADLLAKLDALGTNRLAVEPGTSFRPGSTPSLSADAVPMIRRIAPVQFVSGITTASATVRRTNFVSSAETGGISVQATDSYFALTTGAKLAQGRFFSAGEEALPEIVLGSAAASTLGLADLSIHPLVFVSGNWFTVIGIFEPIDLFPNLDSAAFIGNSVAQSLFDANEEPSTIFVVADPQQVDVVKNVLAATANPESPGETQVSRPSDAIAAKKSTSDALTALLVGLGAVALLVGGIGIANVMVISVLERRTEIGVRRALGATKRHIRLQFVVEAVLLSTLGGAMGLVLGAGVTTGYSALRNISFALPVSVLLIGFGAAIVVGALAGISPASRAAKLAPADAIRPA